MFSEKGIQFDSPVKKEKPKKKIVASTETENIQGENIETTEKDRELIQFRNLSCRLNNIKEFSEEDRLVISKIDNLFAKPVTFYQNLEELQLILFENNNIAAEIREAALSIVNEMIQLHQQTLERDGLAYGNVDLVKINELFEILKNFSVTPDENNKTRFINIVNSLNKEELSAFDDFINNMDIYKNVLDEEMLTSIFLSEVLHGSNIPFAHYWNYGDRKMDVVNKDANPKVVKTLENVFIHANLEPEIISRIIKDFCVSTFSFSHYNNELYNKGLMELFGKMMTYPPIKRYAGETLINYWFEWSDELKRDCKNINFADESNENVRRMVQILDVVEGSYLHLIERGLKPNDDYEDFLLEYINKCKTVSNYFLQNRVNACIRKIGGSSSLLESMDADDYGQRSAYRLAAKAIEELDYFEIENKYRSDEDDSPRLRRSRLHPLGKVTSEKKEKFKNLPRRNINGENFIETKVSPEIIGLMDNSLNLVMVEYKGEIYKFSNLVKLNYKNVLENDDFFDVLNFQNLYMKEIVNKDLGIELSEFDFRTQIQLLNFIKNSSAEKIQEVKEFYGGSISEQGKIDRFKSFLSLEFGKEVGDRILSIGESLKDQPEIADQLFAQYADMADSADKSAEEVCNLYNEIFYNKQISKESIYQIILKRASELLIEASEKLKQEKPGEEGKKVIIDNLIAGLKKQDEIQAALVADLKSIALELNKKYEVISRKYDDIWHENSKQELLHKDLESGATKEEMEDYADYLDMMHEMEADEPDSGIAGSYEICQQALVEHEKRKRFDSERIDSLIKEVDGFVNKNGGNQELEIFKDDLNKYLELQIALEKKLDQVVLGNFHSETDNLLIQKYKEIQKSIIDTSETISACFGDAERYLKPEEIASELFKEAINIISTSTATDEDREKALIKLNGINANVLLTGKIVSQLPREEVAKLDLKKISHIEKLEGVRGSELLNQPEILSQIKQIIKSQFPGGDDEAFAEECRSNPNLRLTIALANKKVLSFFSKEQRSENIDYVDWFIANPDAPIKGLGEATLRLGFDGEEKESQSYYAVAKPHAKSFQILIENLGFVGFNGSTEDGEYKHHYARIRRLTSDTEFKSKNLSENNKELLLKTLDHICSEEGSTQDLVFEGRMMRACGITYHGQTHHDDIKKTDNDGWIMEEIDRQNKKGYVLTRFIPASPVKNNQSFYAVFEKDSASEGLKDELASVVSPESNSHSASKKALSN